MDLKSFFSRFTSKAGNIVSTNDNGIIVNPFQIINGNQYIANLSPEYLVKLNVGWVGICNGKNASTCSSIPLKLYYKNKKGKELKVTKHKQLNPTSTKNLCKSAKIELKQEEVIDEIIEHPLLDLFANINPTMNYYDWCGLNQQYLGILGNSYNEIIFENGLPVQLNPLLGEFVTPVANGKNQGKIQGYVYKPEMNIEKKYKPEEVLHFAQYAPGNMLIGRGDLEDCISAQERYLYYDQFEKYLGLNNSRPDFAVNYKNKLSEKDLKDMYRQWNKRFGGVGNSGKVVVSNGEVDIKPLSLSPRDLQYQVGRQWALKEIAGAFGVPEALVSVTDVNRANAIESTNHYLRYCIYPKMAMFCAKINEQLTPLYDPNLFIWIEEQYLENPVEKITNSLAAYNAGVIDKNEARAVMGYEAVDIEEEAVEPEDDDEPSK